MCLSASGLGELSSTRQAQWVVEAVHKLTGGRVDVPRLLKRHGLARSIAMLLARARGARRALVIDEAQQLETRVLSALMRGLGGSPGRLDSRMATVLLMGNATLPDLSAPGVLAVELPDLAPHEAVDLWMAWRSNTSVAVAEQVLPQLGGIPEFIRAVAASRHGGRAGMLRALAPFAREAREMLEGISSIHPAATARFCQVSNRGACPEQGAEDALLVASGLFLRRGECVVLRADVLAELVLEED